MANTDEPPEVAPGKSDLASAEHLGHRVAVLAARWTTARPGQPAR